MSKKHKVIVLEIDNHYCTYETIEVVRPLLHKNTDWVELSESEYLLLRDFIRDNSYTYILIEENSDITNGSITYKDYVNSLIAKQKQFLKKQEAYQRKLEKQRQERLEKNKAKQIERLQKKLEKLKNNE